MIVKLGDKSPNNLLKSCLLNDKYRVEFMLSGEDMIAIIKSGCQQFKVTEGDYIKIMPVASPEGSSFTKVSLSIVNELAVAVKFSKMSKSIS